MGDGGNAKIPEQHLLTLPDQHILRLTSRWINFLSCAYCKAAATCSIQETIAGRGISLPLG